MPHSEDNYRGIFGAGDLGETVDYVAMPYSVEKYISICIHTNIVI
jgi:hypothetical protein